MFISSLPFTSFLPHFKTFFQAFWAFEFKFGYLRHFKACAACYFKSFQQLVMFEVQVSLDGIKLDILGRKGPGEIFSFYSFTFF